MREFIIKDNDAGQRLDKFLQKAARLLPQSLMYKYLRLKRIKVNGRRSEISYRLQPGDKVSLYIGDEFFDSERPAFYRASPQIRVVYEDENILLYDKGEYRPDEEASFAPALCNRIDRNTGGIVIVAKNAPSLRLLNDCIKNRQLHKFYLCLVKGCPSPRTATLTHYHIKDQQQNRALVYDSPRPGARTMVTHYRVLETKGGYSLVEVELKTGRTHQIRAHLAYMGWPLVGDGKYADNRKERALGFTHQALYSYKLIFDFQEDCLLSYLNGQVFQVKDVWFARDGIPAALTE